MKVTNPCQDSTSPQPENRLGFIPMAMESKPIMNQLGGNAKMARLAAKLRRWCGRHGMNKVYSYSEILQGA